MPALPNVPDVLRFEFKHTVSTDLDVLCRLFFHNAGTAPTNANCVSIATLAQDAWNSNLAAFANDDVVIALCTVTDLTSPTAGTGSHVSADAGTRGTGFLAGGTATLLNYTIGRRYRGGKPRSYWPFGVTGDLNGPNLWSTTYTGDLFTAYGAFLTALLAITTGGVDLDAQVNISYYEGFAPLQNPVTKRWRNIATPRAVPLVDDVLTFAVNGKPASQRRRNTQKR